MLLVFLTIKMNLLVTFRWDRRAAAESINLVDLVLDEKVPLFTEFNEPNMNQQQFKSQKASISPILSRL